MPKESANSSRSLTAMNGENEVFRIQREIQNIYNNLATLESEERTIYGAKTEQLKQLAKDYEALAQKGIYKEPVSHICATICKECHTRNLLMSESLAHRVLEDKYKQIEFTPNSITNPSSTQDVPLTQTDSSNWTTGTTIPGQDPYYYSNPSAAGGMWPTYDEPNKDVQIDFLLNQSKSMDEMNKDELRDMTEKLIDMDRKESEKHRELRRRKKEYLEKCIRNKVALAPQYDNLEENQKHISTQPGEIGISLAWEKLEEYIRILGKVQDKLYYYKPPNKLALEMADALEEEIEFWRPMADEKFRKDTESWWVVQLDNLWHGKHAAAVMNATIVDEKVKKALTNDDHEKIDPDVIRPEIKELLVKEGVVKRSLTREQVGDKLLEVIQRAIRFSEAQRTKAKFRQWYLQELEPRIARRATDLHEVLSDKSFT
jgi:hypothetical protein